MYRRCTSPCIFLGCYISIIHWNKLKLVGYLLLSFRHFILKPNKSIHCFVVFIFYMLQKNEARLRRMKVTNNCRQCLCVSYVCKVHHSYFLWAFLSWKKATKEVDFFFVAFKVSIALLLYTYAYVCDVCAPLCNM